MSNMPILSNNAAATSKTNKHSTANTNTNDEVSPNTQPFGDVLARQLSDKILVDVKGLMETKVDAKPLEMIMSDVAILAAVDPMKVENSIDSLAVSLPIDMLATILPQTAAVAVAPMNIPTQPSISDDKVTIASDKLKSTKNASELTVNTSELTVNASGLTAPAATGVISLKNTQTINTLVGRFTPVDKFSGSTEAPELKAGEIAPKYMTTIIAGKDGASISDKIRGSSDASAVNVDDISKPNAGLITLKTEPATIINKDSAATADMPKGNSESPEPNLGMITHKSMPSISSSKDAAIPSNKLRGSAVASELIADKATQNTVPSITANIATATAPTKIGANVVTFAKELELRDKLDATLAVPSTQATTPQANLVQSMANTPTFGAQAVQLVIDTPITQKQWGNDFSQKITWMATQQDQHAELHLNPAQLGPVDVVIKVSGDQATAQFTSAHAAVREVIEQSIPKLREMLADNGIMLGNATVSDQAPREQRGEFGNQRQTAPSGRLLESAPSNMSDTRVVTPLSRHNGMVDTFA